MKDNEDQVQPNVININLSCNNYFNSFSEIRKYEYSYCTRQHLSSGRTYD